MDTKLSPAAKANLKTFYAAASLNRIAAEIRKNWMNITPLAREYVIRLACYTDINDIHARTTVAYVLMYSKGFKGEVARLIKAELTKRLKSK